ncbi:hypothetical protein CDN99_02755 [Roseateles aquatilis]|uniref:FecR protein domain-containing protein n=1 Tax=Roseateles aquatilis TaxID=431061 RepID=A0A246JLF2_9BURK|nr:DUF6600 domain-containing protein [Roseateles aquatilis]OWQ93415.1 hypothetical protein CDN99_02755 [Roseateles aquatilis]
MTDALNHSLPRPLPRLPSLRWWIAALVALAALMVHGLALADPPTRAGRIAELSGAVWLYDADAREWTEVRRNQTVGEGDRLRADDGGGATITIGSATLWMDQRSEIEFNALADNRISVQIVKGAVGLRLRNQESADEWSLRTLEGRFGFEREGLYRVTQLGRGSEAQSWQGKLRFDSRATDAQPVWLATNEQAEFWWDNGPRTERQPLERDGFARLMLEDARDTVSPPPTAAAYVSPEMTGAEDLGQYGVWEQSPDYGAVWVPAVVVADWAPYRYGRWAWSGRWGWTWVDDMPWGFAPFHYGRWAYWRDRWCWVPGPYVRRPAYSPAMVGWVGGAGVSVGIVVGGRRPPPPRYGGWVPLAPREAWQPPGRYSQAYWRRVNPDPNPATVVRPGGPPPSYRNEREHGPLYTQRPVTAPLPAAALQPQRSWPPRPGGQVDGRPDGRPFVDRNHDGRPDRPDEGGTRPTRGVIRPEPNTATVVPQGNGNNGNAVPNVPANHTVTPQRGPDAQRPQDRREGDREAWRNRPGPDGRGEGDRNRGDRGDRGNEGMRADPVRRDEPVRLPPPRVEPLRNEQPRVEQPRVEQPRIEQPRVEQPRVERPRFEPQPRVEQPRFEPRVEQPRVEQPRVEQPRVEAPRPMPQPPRVEAPRPPPQAPQAPRVEPPKGPPPGSRENGFKQQER